MANIFNIIYSKIEPYYAYILFAVIALIFALFSYWAYLRVAAPAVDDATTNKNDISNYSASAASSNAIEIMLFYADWCPHCRKCKPEWDRFVQAYDGKKVKTYVVRCVSVNCTEETSDVANKIKTYNVEGFPTVKIVKDGNTIDFDSKVTYDALEKYVNTAI
jgi:thiol-disulfide isomerase/thioredoxin